MASQTIPSEFGATVEHYRKIHQQCIRVINILRHRVAGIYQKLCQSRQSP